METMHADRWFLDVKSKSSPASTTTSPGPVVNQLDENARETFATGRPLEDTPDLQQCKHCKKSVLKTAAKAHIAQCLRVKKEKAQRKKEAREARERAKEAAREEEARKADEENGDGKDDDSDGDGDGSPDKKGKAGKKAVGKKPDEKGKKRKADGTLEGGPKAKKKKDEPKAKAPKTKGNPELIRVVTDAHVDTRSQVLLTLNDSVVSYSPMASLVPGHSLARATPWGRKEPLRAGLYLTTCCWQLIKRKTRPNNRVSCLRPKRLMETFQNCSLHVPPTSEAALDANAPVEDDDDLNNGPVDSDEETAAVMSALSNWKPQPVVPQPVFMPIRRQYQLSRLHEQLQMATNGGRTNIFAVTGFGAQKMPEPQTVLLDGEDAPGEVDMTMAGFGNTSRAASIGGSVPPHRQPSVASRG